jgi:hypothetical protein
VLDLSQQCRLQLRLHSYTDSVCYLRDQGLSLLAHFIPLQPGGPYRVHRPLTQPSEMEGSEW